MSSLESRDALVLQRIVLCHKFASAALEYVPLDPKSSVGLFLYILSLKKQAELCRSQIYATSKRIIGLSGFLIKLYNQAVK